MSKTRISPKFKWMESYLQEGLQLLPAGKVLARLGAWSIGNSRGANVFAALFQDRVGDVYRIWLHTHYKDGNNQIKSFSKVDLLSHLAHELAHMESWEHTPDHKKLEAKITRKFMSMLKKDGYISEENEEKENS